MTEWKDNICSNILRVSVRCINGGGDMTEWKDNRGKIMHAVFHVDS